MKDILKHLYYGNINESERGIEEFLETEEYKKYYEAGDKFDESLTDEQKQLYNEFFLRSGSLQDLHCERAYANGVKFGIWLMLEVMDFDPKSCKD